MKDNLIEIDLKDYKELKILYKKALEEDKKIFIFKDRELLVNYAKYLIEYLNLRFRGG